jgi:hypothetical protein
MLYAPLTSPMHTYCTPTKSNLYFANFLSADFDEPAL